jgi:pimeloyl-ACP methyl ester carboxylesterase
MVRVMLKLAPVTPCYLPVLLLAALGCATTSYEVHSVPPTKPIEGVIFVADGAGNFLETSKALRQAIEEESSRFQVETVFWSHGYSRVFSDHLDHAHTREVGQELAAELADFHRAHPNQAIHLVGHSAGAAVILAAADALPPASVDHIILLAPSIAATYDLRPALRSSREGMEVFSSRLDWFFLGIGVGLLGTTEGRWQAAAGRVGFRPELQDPMDALLYRKLREHAWDPSVEWTGNHGGHYGPCRPEFQRAYVLPILSPRHF